MKPAVPDGASQTDLALLFLSRFFGCTLAHRGQLEVYFLAAVPELLRPGRVGVGGPRSTKSACFTARRAGSTIIGIA